MQRNCEKKQELFENLRENYKSLKNEFRVLSYDNWFKKDLNNTHLLSVKRYNSKVDKFEILFDQQGKDWRQVFPGGSGTGKRISRRARSSFIAVKLKC